METILRPLGIRLAPPDLVAGRGGRNLALEFLVGEFLERLQHFAVGGVDALVAHGLVLLGFIAREPRDVRDCRQASMITLSAFVFAAWPKRVVSVEDPVELEAMSDQKLGVERFGSKAFEQHWRAHGIDEARGDRDVAVPQALEMEIHLGPMHADVRDDAARRNKLLAKLEGSGDADRFDRRVDSAPTRHRHDLRDRFTVAAVDASCGAETLGHFKAIVVEIDHDDLGRGIELGCQQGREPDRSRTDDCDRIARLNLAVENAAFEAGRQNVAQHDQRFLVGACRYWIEARLRIGNANELGLGPVDLVAENPAAVHAMRIHELSAIDALAAGGDAGDQDAVSGFEHRDGRPDLLDDANALVAENPAGLTGRNVALEDVKVGAANRRQSHFDDSVGRRRDAGLRPLLQGFVRRAEIDESFHRFCLLVAIRASGVALDREAATGWRSGQFAPESLGACRARAIESETTQPVRRASRGEVALGRVAVWESDQLYAEFKRQFVLAGA